MNRTPVSSTTFASVGYDEASRTLEAEFVSGTVYQYFGVPPEVHRAFVESSSLGNYFGTHIRNVYRFAKMS